MAQVKVKFNRGVEGATNIVDAGTEGTKVAAGTTAQRGSTTGQYRYNTTTGFFEGYNGTSFVALAPTPTVSSVSPTEVESAAGGNQDFVIQGTNFDTGTTVKFVANDNSEFSASSVVLNSSIQITATVAKSSFQNSKEPYDVVVTANSGLTASKDNTINVDNSPSWTTAAGSLGGGFEGDNYSFTVTATDADGDTVAYSLQSGALPSGGNLDSSTGVISGTHPTVSSNTTATFTIRATSGGKTSDRQFSILTINPTTNIYTSSGSFTLAAPQSVKVYVIGGGGGGGSTSQGSSGGAGGGGGGMAYKLFSNLAAGTYNYTVGGKGASNTAGSSGAGGAGGTSSFSGTGITTVQATGGGGGTAWVSTSQAGTGGAGGVGSGGDVNGTGGAGGNGIAESNPGTTVYNGNDGSNGTNGGAGGGGGGTDLGSGNPTDKKAGDGGDGSSTYYTGGGGGAGWDNDGQTAYNSQRGLGGSGYTSGGNGGNMAIASTDGGGNAGGARGSSGSTRNTYGGGGASYGGGGGGSGSGDGGQYPEAGQGGGGAVVIIS